MEAIFSFVPLIKYQPADSNEYATYSGGQAAFHHVIMPRMSIQNDPNTEPEIEPKAELEEELVEADPRKEAETFTFKRSHFYAVMTVLAFAVGMLLGYVVWGYQPTAGQTQAAAPVVAQAQATEPPQFQRYDIPTKGFPTLGPADAPITLVEFSDYQCPFCRRWHQEVYEQLLAAYPGKIRIVYRNLPLTSIHPDAMAAAEAAMCAGEQDAYWPFHNKLFSSESLNQQTFLQYAQELSLNVETFKTCITDEKYKDAITSDSDFAINLGIRSTPTFFINGLAVVGAQPLEVFKQVIDKELAGEIPKQ
jgi:protein-disulfide isomerase